MINVHRRHLHALVSFFVLVCILFTGCGDVLPEDNNDDSGGMVEAPSALPGGDFKIYYYDLKPYLSIGEDYPLTFYYNATDFDTKCAPYKFDVEGTIYIERIRTQDSYYPYRVTIETREIKHYESFPPQEARYIFLDGYYYWQVKEQIELPSEWFNKEHGFIRVYIELKGFVTNYDSLDDIFKNDNSPYIDLADRRLFYAKEGDRIRIFENSQEYKDYLKNEDC